MAVVFAVCLITSNFFVPRVWQVGSLPLQLSGAVLLFPVSYIINDCLTEVYGYRKARLVIWLAFALSAFVAVMSGLVCMLPEPLDPGSKPVSDSFDSLLPMMFSPARLYVPAVGRSRQPMMFMQVDLPEIGMVFTQVVVKTLYELVVLPVTTLCVRYLKRKEQTDVYDENISYNPFRIGDL